MRDVLEEFRDKCVLVVEDDYLLAQDLRKRLEGSFAVVVGPVATVNETLDLIDVHRIDVAILDVMLETDFSYPVANALEAKDIPWRCHVVSLRPHEALFVDSGCCGGRGLPVRHSADSMDVDREGGVLLVRRDEMISDCRKHRDESLQAADRSEALHHSFSFS